MAEISLFFGGQGFHDLLVKQTANWIFLSLRLDLKSWRDVIDFGRIKRDSFSLTIRPSILWNGSLCLRQEVICFFFTACESETSIFCLVQVAQTLIFE